MIKKIIGFFVLWVIFVLAPSIYVMHEYGLIAAIILGVITCIVAICFDWITEPF